MPKRKHSAMASPFPDMAPRTYFGDISDAALKNILRCSAHQPRRQDWSGMSNAKLLGDIARPDHRLRKTAKKTMNKLDLSLFSLAAIDLSNVLNTYGSNCLALSVDSFRGRGIPQVWPWRNLKVLRWDMGGTSVHLYSFRSLLGTTSKLEELKLRLRQSCPSAVMGAVTEFGAGLQKLSIDGLDLNQGDAVSRMLQATGPTLQSLKIG